MAEHTWALARDIMVCMLLSQTCSNFGLLKDVETTLRNLIRNHHRPGLVHELKTLVFGILQRKLGILIELANTLLVEHSIPKYIPLIIKDLASFRLGLHKIEKTIRKESLAKNFINIPFHNKGLEMIGLSQILRSKPVVKSIPYFI